MSKKLIEVLENHRGKFHKLTPFDLTKERAFVFDLSSANSDLASINLNDQSAFNQYIFDSMEKSSRNVGLGKYNEDREIYKRSEVFSTNKVRSIHLGIDIWAKEETPVYAPLDGKIHSFKNNNQHGDYGPTIILQHELDGIEFYTLYGHLSLKSIADKQIGQRVKSGDQIATLGDYEVNVHWPPHLHFQIINDLEGNFGDYPGVASKTERKQYLDNCPNANLIVNSVDLAL